MQKQENEKLDAKQIDIQPHGKVRSRRARQLAEERAKTRSHWIDLMKTLSFVVLNRVWERHMAEQKRLEEQAQKLSNNTHSKSSDIRKL